MAESKTEPKPDAKDGKKGGKPAKKSSSGPDFATIGGFILALGGIAVKL